jgi:hypothetical protein
MQILLVSLTNTVDITEDWNMSSRTNINDFVVFGWLSAYKFL